jgi:lipoprotein-anchoring transpeptidase ErfK/SrfK
MRWFAGLVMVSFCALELASASPVTAQSRKDFRATTNLAPGPSTGPTTVPFAAPYEPGALVIVNSERSLYYVLEEGQAVRYRVAIGNPDEVWTGRQIVTAKKENPRWVSPDDDTWFHEGGDPENPLGVRAMYLGWTLWRIHGTPNAKSIGRNVSNGCIRMRNEDVVELFDRVHIGAPVYAVEQLTDAMPQHAARKLSDE